MCKNERYKTQTKKFLRHSSKGRIIKANLSWSRTWAKFYQ